MKYLFLILFSLANYSFAQEGVSTDIDPKRLNEVMDWVNNAKFELDLGAKNIAMSPHHEQEKDYSNLIDTVLKASGSRPNEFLMRNLLYRTQVVYKTFQNTPRSPKRDALARRVLEDGVLWAIKLYEADKTLLDQMKSKEIPNYIRGVSFVNLGLEWTQYMFGLYYSAPDNKSKVRLMRDLMGLLYNDINNDDSVKRVLAPISGRLASKDAELKNLLQNNPPKTPLEELALARELRRFIDQHIQATRDLLTPYTTELNVAKSQQTITVNQDLTDKYLKIISRVIELNCDGEKKYLRKGGVIQFLSKVSVGTKLKYSTLRGGSNLEKVSLRVVSNFSTADAKQYEQQTDAPLDCEADVPFANIINADNGKLYNFYEVMTPTEIKLLNQFPKNAYTDTLGTGYTVLLDPNTHKPITKFGDGIGLIINDRDQAIAHEYDVYMKPIEGKRALYQRVRIKMDKSEYDGRDGYIRVNHIQLK